MSEPIKQGTPVRKFWPSSCNPPCFQLRQSVLLSAAEQVRYMVSFRENGNQHEVDQLLTVQQDSC